MCAAVLVAALAGCAASEGEGKAAATTKPVAAKVKNGTTTVKKREPIPFQTHTRKSARLKKGVRKVMAPGHRGLRVTTWRVTTKNGKVVDRKRLSTKVVTRPQARVVVIGTYVAPRQVQGSCDINYSPCVPVSSDVDCAGGSGDGPVYQSTPVRIVGNDPYGLDADGDGWGCDS